MDAVKGSTLESETQSEGELLGVRRSHTTSIEELGILTIKFLVGIEQTDVGGSELERSTAETQVTEERGWEVVSERHLFQTDESTVGDACSTVVICIVTVADVGVVVHLTA